MARLTRKTSKLFCENALQSDVGQFGSLNAGTKVETKDIDTIQNLAAWQNGWQASGLGQNCYPTRQERNGLDYVQSYMVNYLNQEGIAEYDAGTTYYTGSVVKLINGTDVQLFKSIANSNTGNALTNTSYWEELSFGLAYYGEYCFISGKVNANGEPDLLDITDTSKVVFNVDNSNVLKGVLADGTEFERSSIADLSVSALADGNYNLFIGESGNCIPLANTIYRQRKQMLTYSEYVLVGTPTIINGILSNCDNNNYITTYSYPQNITSMEMQLEFTTSTVGLSLGLIGESNNFTLPRAVITSNNYLTIYLSSNGSTWNTVLRSTAISANTTYTLNIKWDGTTVSATLKNGNTTTTFTVVSGYTDSLSQLSWADILPIGKEFNSSINLNNSFININGERWNSFININTNDVWLDTSVKPYKSYKYDGSDWEEFNYVNLPQSITVGSGVITIVNQSGSFNDNGYDMGRDTLTHNAFPSSKYDELSLGASGSTYIAPADGYFLVYKSVTSAGQYVDIYTNNSLMVNGFGYSNSSSIKLFMPVSKGEIVTIDYTANGITHNFRFIYANGEV